MKIEDVAAVRPDRPAVIMASSGQVTTYGELAAGASRMAQHIRKVGLRRGDHVALMMDNRSQFLEVAVAALQSGLYLTPVNRHLAPDELAYVVGDSEAKVVVASAALAATCNAVDWSALPGVLSRLMVGGAGNGFEDYDTVLAAYEEEPPSDPAPGALMLYTSGTTGRPKGVLRPLPESFDQVDARDEAFQSLFALDKDSVYLSPAPLYHAAPLGFSLAVLGLGGTVVVMEKFDAREALQLIERHRVTHSQWVPTMFVRMLALPDKERAAFDLSSHRLAVHAAAPCPVDVKRQMISWWGPILLEYYGGTEGAGMTMITSEEWLEHPGSVGLGPTVRIIGEEQQELPPGEVGLVYFVNPAPFVYKGDADKTERSRLPGSLTTMGDCGYLDADGWLHLTDRKDFMIISGGVNIYPQEIEDVLIAHPSVLDAVVFGVPNGEFGEEVKAVVEPVAGVEPSQGLVDTLMEHCRSNLARFKCPRTIDFVHELPRTPTGKLVKLVKRELRDRYTA